MHADKLVRLSALDADCEVLTLILECSGDNDRLWRDPEADP